METTDPQVHKDLLDHKEVLVFKVLQVQEERVELQDLLELQASLVLREQLEMLAYEVTTVCQVIWDLQEIQVHQDQLDLQVREDQQALQEQLALQEPEVTLGHRGLKVLGEIRDHKAILVLLGQLVPLA